MTCDCNNPAQCWEPCGSLGHDAAHAFPYEGTRPLTAPPPVGQQLVDAWRAEHGDEAFPE